MGMGYVESRFAAPGTALEMEMRGRLVPARVVAGRFVA
ncbi:MAG: hypothetical protein DIU83_11040 [Bacillota bacterium]|nr:MAG: hypothetical protein DIU83_11040 [Bacillota bacterium]